MNRCLSMCLDGTWSVAQLPGAPEEGAIPSLDGLDWLSAQVPGEIHHDLLKAGRVPNLFSSLQAAKDSQWVCEADWIYKCEFDLPAEAEDAGHIFLNLDSVDTFADVFVNGALVGVTRNAFIRQAFALDKSRLKEQGNELIIRLKAHRRMVADKAQASLDRSALDGKNGAEYAVTRSITRRSQRTYSGELAGFGEYVIGIGIPKSVYLSCYPQTYIADSVFRVVSAREDRAMIEVSAELCADACDASIRFRLIDPMGTVAHECEVPAYGLSAETQFRLDQPMLWWPNGYGEQNLYTFEVSAVLMGEVVYTQIQQVGVRQVELIRALPSGKPCFKFSVNGKPVYVFGGNLMPIEYLSATGTPKQSEQLLDMAKQAGINLMRLWGGGNNESEWFYRMCDERGIMIWKDMHLHSHTYPDFDEDFVREVNMESAESVRYLRNHPCLAILCGGNEQQEGWDAWHWRDQVDAFYGGRMNYDELPGVCAEMCPEIPYIPNSPHGETLSQSPVDGETHTWGNFYNTTKDPQFVTETCWFYGSYPRPETIKKYMDVDVDDFQGLGWHKKWRELTGQELIGNQQYTEYHPLESLGAYMRGMEIEQLMADYHALFYLRCRSASCNGIVYWPFNKGGMFILYGCVDYDQRPLMPYYLLPRLFAPVACHLYRDVSDIRLVASNSTWKQVNAQVVIRHMHADGRELRRWTEDVVIPMGNANRLMNLDGYYEQIIDRRREMLHVEVYEQGVKLTEDDLYFCAWAEFVSATADIQCAVECTEQGWQLTIQCDALAKMVSLESSDNLLFSENYFSMMPGTTRTVSVRVLDALSDHIEVQISALDSPGVTKVMLSR